MPWENRPPDLPLTPVEICKRHIIGSHYGVTLWDLAKREAPSLPVYGLCKECTFYLSFYSVVVLRNYSKQWLRRDRVCFFASRQQAAGIVCVFVRGGEVGGGGCFEGGVGGGGLWRGGYRGETS